MVRTGSRPALLGTENRCSLTRQPGPSSASNPQRRQGCTASKKPLSPPRQRHSRGPRVQGAAAHTNRPECRGSQRKASAHEGNLRAGQHGLHLTPLPFARPKTTSWVLPWSLKDHITSQRRAQTSELFCNRRTNMRRWWSWPPKNTASTWTSRWSARGRNQYTARSRARWRRPGRRSSCDSPRRGAVANRSAAVMIASMRTCAWHLASASGSPKPQ